MLGYNFDILTESTQLQLLLGVDIELCILVIRNLLITVALHLDENLPGRCDALTQSLPGACPDCMQEVRCTWMFWGFSSQEVFLPLPRSEWLGRCEKSKA